MISIPLAQAKNQLSELISRVEGGEVVEVTRRGRPVAHLVPCEGGDAAERGDKVGQIFARLAQLRCGVVLEGDLKTIARQGLD